MGRSNAVIRTYIGKAERFADLFNYYLFCGLTVIKAEDLEPVDGESDIIIENKEEDEMEVHRYRDITMRWKYGAKFTILACENQERVHYAMPVRTMLYDSLSYVDQIKRIGSSLKDKKVTREEFLSKFRKDDKLIPVITLIFYYGLEEWDASKDLYGMLEVNEYLKESDIFKRFIPNYKINLIDVGHMDNIENLQTDLQVMIGMLQYRSNTEKLERYIREHEDYFTSVDKDTYNAMGELLRSKSKLKKALKTVVSVNGEERVNVCKAIDGIYENGYNQAIKDLQQFADRAEMKAQRAEAEKQKAEAEKQKAEAEKQRAEEKVQKVLKEAAAKMLATMEAQEVARLLGLELEIINQLRITSIKE